MKTTMKSGACLTGLGFGCASLVACSILNPLPPLKGPLEPVAGAAGTDGSAGEENAGGAAGTEPTTRSRGGQSATGGRANERTADSGVAGYSEESTGGSGGARDNDAQAGAEAGVATGGASSPGGTAGGENAAMGGSTAAGGTGTGGQQAHAGGGHAGEGDTAGGDSGGSVAAPGDAGAGGAGMGGAAGTEPVACSTREDCENENADPTNCDVDCDTSGAVGQCVFTARDVDGDGYTSAACARAPGDDCDDTTPLVSPGSTETCDGRDNDCDGYADALDANIELAGSPRAVSGGIDDPRRIDITWHEDEFFFVVDGILGPDTSGYTYTSIFAGYARIDGSFASYGDEILVADMSTFYDSPRVTSLAGTLGLLLHQDGRASGARFAILDDQGTVVNMANGLGGSGDIVHDGSSFIMATTNSTDAFLYATGSASGAVAQIASRDSLPDVRYQNAAQSGSVTGVVYTDTSESQPSVQLMRLSSGVMLGPTELAQPAQIGDIATLPSGDFAMAWATPAGFKLQVRTNTATTVVCDAPETTFGNGTLDELDSVAVADSSLGILVFAADAGGTTGEGAVFVFDHDCTLLTEQGKQVFDRTVHTSEGELPHLPRIAVGGGHVAFAWTVQQSDDPESFSSYVRVVPEALCE